MPSWHPPDSDSVSVQDDESIIKVHNDAKTRFSWIWPFGIWTICSEVEVLVLSVVVLFAAHMSVIIMSLEFGMRPTNKKTFKQFCSSVALYGYKLAFHPPLVRWKYMSSGYCTKLVVSCLA